MQHAMKCEIQANKEINNIVPKWEVWKITK